MHRRKVNFDINKVDMFSLKRLGDPREQRGEHMENRTKCKNRKYKQLFPRVAEAYLGTDTNMNRPYVCFCMFWRFRDFR